MVIVKSFIAWLLITRMARCRSLLACSTLTISLRRIPLTGTSSMAVFEKARKKIVSALEGKKNRH